MPPNRPTSPPFQRLALTMDRAPPPWLSTLCSQLESCQTIESVQELLDELDKALLFELQVETVLNQLQAATQPQQLQELFLSYGSWTSQLSTWLLKSFPTSAEEFFASIHIKVLERLSLFLLFLQYPFEREIQLFLARARIRVELTPPILKAITGLSFDKIDYEGGEDIDEAEFDGLVIKKRKQNKKRNTRQYRSNLNPRDLEKLDVSEPQSEQEALETTQALLRSLKLDLEDYLSILQHDEVVLVVQGMFINRGHADPSAGQHDAESDLSTVESKGTLPPELPPAYPLVQPMKAALYFESASGFGEWRILISTRADRDLREARRSDAKFFKIVIKKIIELSNGHFSNDNQKRLNGPNVHFPVYEAKMTRDSRLVYQIDCIPEYDNDYERQVIKIFGIYTHAQIDGRFWDSMGYQLAKKGKLYRERCKFRNRPHHTGDNVIQPATFPQKQEDEVETLVVPELPKEDLEEIHSLLVLEKFVTLSKELLKTIFADLDVAHVFNVTPQEKEIIEHPFSCYVLGRSGTGKTTTMLFKMLGIERAYAQKSESLIVMKPRQIFVTQSRVLATRVEEYFGKLMESLSASQKSKEELKAIADQKKLQQEEATLLYDVDDDITWKASLPPKFSLLKDEHFPLFLTFERLSQLLEGDIDTLQSVLRATTSSKSQLMTYELFLGKYWPHFPQDLTKNLDPALVFNEFLGVIEGSEQSLSHESRYLDQVSYASLSHRAQHVFSKQRERVYALFLAYLKHKRKCGDLDSADRTHRVLKAFEATGIPGTKIDYLYVDEAQDNLLIDAMLLRSLCRNPNGLFWAGDTAQTIAIGSSFRFNDLKAFLYRLEQRREQKLIDDSGISQSELRTFELAVNYRSHGGIVGCATAVIELITHFWPYAIDALTPEKGIVDGAKPVFFSGWDTNTVRYEQFLFGDSGERIEFGARQCILVRDETARAELRQQVGDIGLILTLYESKGLEFDDVLLYKFFEDSKVDLNQWRVVLNRVQTSKGANLLAPRFDEERHAGVCSELKFLYVAITRSRKNLWIVDCSEKAEPMRSLWSSNGLIQDCKPGSDVPRLAVTSTTEEWANTGRTLFTNRRWLQAMHAFERAGLAREAKITHTHYLRENARLIPPTNRESLASRREAFCAAAKSFVECAQDSNGKERRVFFHNAGDCFEMAASCGNNTEDYGNAARAYEAAKEYNSAVKLYRKSDMFDEAVQVVRDHRHEVDPELATSVLEIARLFYFREREFGKAKALFDSVDEQLEYLEDNILLDECHATVLAELGRYQEAADIHISEGRTREAIEVLLKDNENSVSIQQANDCIIQGLWQHISFARRIKDDDTRAIEFLELASRIDHTLLTPSQKDEITMFQSLRTSVDSTPLRQLAFNFLKRNERHQAFLCFDHYFINFPNIVNITNVDLVVVLDDFFQHSRLFRELILALDLNDEATQKLFNIKPASIENAFRLRVDCWLYPRLDLGKQGVKPQVQVLENDDEAATIPGPDLLQALKVHLWQRLKFRLKRENLDCQRIAAFTPCFQYVMNDTCRRNNCPRSHILYQELTQTWFNNQIRIHLLQIQIYQVYHSIPSPNFDSIRERRYWIHRLCETLRPTAHYLGSQASFRPALLPEAQPTFEIVKNWSRDILGTREQQSDRMLLTFIYEAATLYLLFDRENALQYLPRAPLLGTFERYPSYHRPLNNGTTYVLPELYQCLQAMDVNFISAGILFLRQVVERKIHIDVNVLCHLVEFLTGSVILGRVQFNLDNVTLPRGWFLILLRQISMRQPDTRLIDQLLNSISLLLKDLVRGGEVSSYLFFETRDIGDLPVIRELFIPRLCRALGLIGYNLAYPDLHRKILEIMKILHPAKPHPLFGQYLRARFWGGIRRAVEESYTDSHLDEMVQLRSMEKEGDRKIPPPKGVRRVFFNKLEDVPLALSTGPMRADAPAFVPSSARAKSEADTSITVEEEGETEEQPTEEPEAGGTALVDSREFVDSLANTAAPLAAGNITDEQKTVAEILTVVYRQVIRNRKLEKNKSPAQKTWDSFFITCLDNSKTMEWPYGFYYRKLYLGLVPHLLACLNGVESYAHSTKKKAKKRLLEDKQDLDGLNKKMTELNAIFKTSKNLLKQLEPFSEMHKRRDIEQLKRVAGEVADLVTSVPIGAGLDIQFHLELAIKGIVMERKPPKAAPKPELNTLEEEID